MQSTEGKLGKVVLAKFDNGEELLGGLTELAKKHDLRTAIVFLVGALKDAKVVTGPKMPVIPPIPTWFNFDDGREVFGIGTIFRDGNEPKLHIHTGLGKGEKGIVGCVRERARVFLVVEAFIMEMEGIEADKAFDPASGLSMLRILSGGQIGA